MPHLRYGASLMALLFQCRRCRFQSWVGKIPWRREWQPTPVLLHGKSHGQRSLTGYSPWGCKRVRHDLANKQQRQQLRYGRKPPGHFSSPKVPILPNFFLPFKIFLFVFCATSRFFVFCFLFLETTWRNGITSCLWNWKSQKAMF